MRGNTKFHRNMNNIFFKLNYILFNQFFKVKNVTEDFILGGYFPKPKKSFN